MSEYQYYEFAAIDGPISDEGLRHARACSSSYSYGRDKMLAIARRAATPDQCRALEGIRGA